MAPEIDNSSVLRYQLQGDDMVSAAFLWQIFLIHNVCRLHSSWRNVLYCTYLICQKFWFIRSKACVYCIKTACNRLNIIFTSASSARSKCKVWFLTIITCHIVPQLLDLTRCVMHQWLQKFLYDQTLAWLFRSEKIHFGRPYISFVVLQLGNQLFFERHDGYDFDEERYFCWTM